MGGKTHLKRKKHFSSEENINVKCLAQVNKIIWKTVSESFCDYWSLEKKNNKTRNTIVGCVNTTFYMIVWKIGQNYEYLIR